MTTETLPTSRITYTVSGTGPYNIGHEYTEGSIVVTVQDGTTGDVILTADHYGIVPLSGDDGDVTLTIAAAALHDGKTLVIARDTILEQGWAGQTAREIGLEAQLDRQMQGIQDNRRSVASALRISGQDVAPYTPQDGTVPVWNETAGQFESGPNGADLASAEGYAAAAVAAAASALGAAEAVFDTVADLLASVAAFPADTIVRTRSEGFAYKARAAGATDYHLTTAGGALLRVLPNDMGAVSIAQWGVAPGGDDIHAALQTAVDNFRAVFIPATAERTQTGTNSWYCSGTINVNREVRIFGVTGTQARVHPSSIRWDSGMPGFIFHYYDTEGDSTGTVAIKASPDLQVKADGSRIEMLALLAGNGSDPAIIDDTSHAIWAKVRVGVYDCFISGWQGSGIRILATASSSDPLVRGNANNWDTKGNRVQNCADGLFIDGADVNAGVSMHDDMSSCGHWGLYDSSFLGNTFFGLHTNGNGDLARRQWQRGQYMCIDTSQSATVTPGTDTSVWWEYGHAGPVDPVDSPAWASGSSYAVNDYVLSSNGRVYKVNTAGGGTSADEPLFDGSTAQTLADGYRWTPTQNDVWVSGVAVPEGGAKKVDSDSSVTSFVSCYDEASQAVAYDQSVLAIYPGHGIDQESTGKGVMMTQKGWTKIKGYRFGPAGEEIVYDAFGQIGSGKFTDAHLGSLDIDGLTFNQRVSFVDTTRGAVVLRDANSDSQMTWMETLYGTNQTFGRTDPVPHAKYVKNLMLGSNPANGRQITFATAEPTSGQWARGDVIFNQNPSAGGVFGWQCVTSGTAGVDAVFKAMGSLAA